MATATEPKQTDAAGYVDFDEFIDYQITKTRSGIKTTDLLTAFIGGAAVVLAYVLVFALFDHWIVGGGFSAGTRIGLLSLLVTGLVGWTAWKLVLPYFRQVTPLYAARQIEQAQPDLKNSLLTLVDLKRAGRPVPEAIATALEKRSARTLSHMDVEEAVDRRLLMRLSYVLFALVVLTCAYVLFSPKSLSNSLWRALLPASNVSVATRTRIDQVEPGDVEVLARAQLTVTADLSGEIPKETRLLFTTADRRFVDEPVAMREADQGLRRFSGVITGENGAGILQNLTYRVVAGDAESEVYSVTVKQPPAATVQEVQYEYPGYMGLDSRMQPGGAIDAWEGTWVTMRARANMPLSSAMVLFSDTEDTSQKAEEIPAEIAGGTDITARWRLRIRSDGTYANFYRVQCLNEAGERSVEPTLYSVKIRPDLPPRIELAQPTGDIERPANAIVPLLYAAEDPDFLLRSVILHFELNGDPLPQQPRLYQAPPFRKSLHDVYNLELASLGLNPQDQLTYWLEARDNMEPFADRSGNRANTPKLNITITEPASPQAVQEQLEEDQQQIAEKLDDASQPPGEESHDPDAEPQPSGEDTQPPPPNDGQPQEQAPESQPTDANDQSQQQSGQSGAGGEPQPGSSGQSGRGQQQGGAGQKNGEETGPGGERQSGAGDNSPNDAPQGEESFDDLLERLMQREQQREKQPGESTQPRDGEQQQQRENQAQPGEEQQPGSTGEQNQSGESAGPSGSKNATGQPASAPGTPGESTSPSPGDSSAGEPSPGAQPSMNQTPSPGLGADPASPSQPGANPDGTNPQPGETPGPGGDPTANDRSAPSSGEKPTNDGTTPGGQKQPEDDPTGARPGNTEGTDTVQPKPGATEDGQPFHDQPGPKAGEPTTNPSAKTGSQPDGPDEPMQGPGDPQGQKSDQPQTGEGGNSQQTSQGNKGSDQQGAGDSTGRPGAQETAGGQTGQSGDQKSGEGTQQQPGGSKSGNQGSEASEGQSPSSGQQGGQKNQGGQKPAGTEPGDKPAGADDSSSSDSGASAKRSETEGEPSGAEGQPSGEKGSNADQSSGKDGGASGQEGESEGQPGQSGEGQSGQSGSQAAQGGQPGEGPSGNQPGSPPSGGSPTGPGTGTTSDGGSMDNIEPRGGGGGEGNEVDTNEGSGGDGARPGVKPEDPDLEAKRKSANLVLEQLREQLQRGEIDPELRKELNVTPEQLQEFTQRLEQRLSELESEDTSAEAQARRRQFEETLRTIDYESKGTTRAGGDGPREATGGFAGPNRPAPPEHRDAARLYRERLIKKQSTPR